jgi:ribosomal protein S18 acetylase RimI-like enzyme
MTQIIENRTATCFLRSAKPEDEEFLFRLFADSQEHLTVFRSNEALYQSLVEMQYRGRKLSYAAEYPQAVDAILCVEDEAEGAMPVGRLLVDCQPDRWRIVDIALLAAHRGKGLGGWALEQCKRQCGEAAGKLALEVRPDNRARRLYERLGFHVTYEDLLTVEMVLDIVNLANTTRIEPLVTAL